MPWWPTLLALFIFSDQAACFFGARLSWRSRTPENYETALWWTLIYGAIGIFRFCLMISIIAFPVVTRPGWYIVIVSFGSGILSAALWGSIGYLTSDGQATRLSRLIACILERISRIGR